jgi:hypothetical protein
MKVACLGFHYTAFWHDYQFHGARALLGGSKFMYDKRFLTGVMGHAKNIEYYKVISLNMFKTGLNCSRVVKPPVQQLGECSSNHNIGRACLQQYPRVIQSFSPTCRN